MWEINPTRTTYRTVISLPTVTRFACVSLDQSLQTFLCYFRAKHLAGSVEVRSRVVVRTWDVLATLSATSGMSLRIRGRHKTRNSSALSGWRIDAGVYINHRCWSVSQTESFATPSPLRSNTLPILCASIVRIDRRWSAVSNVLKYQNNNRFDISTIVWSVIVINTYKSHSSDDLKLLRSTTNRYHAAVIKAKTNFNMSLISSQVTNPRQLWKTANNLLHRNLPQVLPSSELSSSLSQSFATLLSHLSLHLTSHGRISPWLVISSHSHMFAIIHRHIIHCHFFLTLHNVWE